MGAEGAQGQGLVCEVRLLCQNCFYLPSAFISPFYYRAGAMPSIYSHILMPQPAEGSKRHIAFSHDITSVHV